MAGRVTWVRGGAGTVAGDEAQITCLRGRGCHTARLAGAEAPRGPRPQPFWGLALDEGGGAVVVTFHPSMAAPLGPVKFWRPGKVLGGTLCRCGGLTCSRFRDRRPGACGPVPRPDLGGPATAALVLLVGSATQGAHSALEGLGVRSQPGQKLCVTLFESQLPQASFSSLLMSVLPNTRDGETLKHPRVPCYRPGATLGPDGRCYSGLRSSSCGAGRLGFEFSALRYGSIVSSGQVV